MLRQGSIILHGYMMNEYRFMMMSDSITEYLNDLFENALRFALIDFVIFMKVLYPNDCDEREFNFTW